MSRNRSWCFTINNDKESDLIGMMQCPFKYMIFGFEVGSDKKTSHIQGYVQMPDTKTLTAMKKWLPRAHLEIAKGTPQQNIEYCSKDGSYYEIGTKPTAGGKVTFDQIKEAYADPDNNMTIIRQYGKTYKEVKQLHINNQKLKTKYYVMNPNDHDDWMTELSDRLQNPHMILIKEIGELAAYEDEEIHTVVLLLQWMDPLIQYYPRGVPIKYKYGYEYHTCRPKNFVILTTDFDKLFPCYKKI